MFIFLSYKKFIGGAGLLVQHHAQNCYCIPQEDRGFCVSPRMGSGQAIGTVRLSSSQWKGHRPWDRMRELQTHRVEGVVGMKDEEQDGVWQQHTAKQLGQKAEGKVYPSILLFRSLSC